eukprot:CAMPEP_0196579676 /NCGR_PEP_ID=MMETSP1081-20130531/24447_1 /TAXON_ID=36882 /ORGANISM="Pyramimonas amylifera, Strain CCMP720" /LENGTH=158 /DNA_ID=CAMNT_0041899329 /DNA_START=434 /DNA_END=907 /DNA_ORIENTATION=+
MSSQLRELQLPSTHHLCRLEGTLPLSSRMESEKLFVDFNCLQSVAASLSTSRETIPAPKKICSPFQKEDEMKEEGLVNEDLEQLYASIVGPMGAADKLQLLLAELCIDENMDEAKAVSGALYDLLNDRDVKVLPHTGAMLQVFMTGFALNTPEEDHAW